MTARPYLFSFWTSDAPMPEYIRLCRETVFENLKDAFEIVPLDFDSCLDWVPERDRLWRLATPVTQGKSHSMAGRHIAQFTGMLRVGLLARHGGLWVDADQIAFPNFAHLAPLVATRDLVAPEDADGALTNAVLGACAGSGFAAALWAELCARLDAKEAAGEIGARWGEHGFRMVNHVWQASPPERPFVAPFGALISFDTAGEHDVFTPQKGRRQSLSPLALGLSVFNNGLDDDLRAMTAEDLRATGSLFALAEAVAMGRDGSLDDWLMIRGADQLAALDRSAQVGRMLDENARALATNLQLKDRLAERNQQLIEAREMRDAALATQAERNRQLAEARETRDAALAAQAERNQQLAEMRETRDAALAAQAERNQQLAEMRETRDAALATQAERNQQLAEIRAQRDTAQVKLKDRNRELDALRARHGGTGPKT